MWLSRGEEKRKSISNFAQLTKILMKLFNNPAPPPKKKYIYNKLKIKIAIRTRY